MNENREYRSDVFSMLMEYPEYALQVFNALNGTNYSDPEVVEMCTLAKGISLSVRNDASFIIDMHLSIYEHQSTYNPNMPLRAAIYLGEVIRPWLKGRDLYASRRIMIPTPHLVVFYNGVKGCPEKEVQRLSDSYRHDGEPEVEVICTLYNINAGNNEDLLDRCPVMREYMIFVNRVRENEEAESENPIADAIDWCVENGVLKEFLSERRKEVIKAMTIDMTFEAREEIIRNEGIEQGIEQGMEKGMEKGILTSLRNLMTNLKLSAEEAITTLGIAPEDNEKYLSMLSRKEV